MDMAWVSADNGAMWQHHPLNVRDLGYAPTVVYHRGRFLLAANGRAIYASSWPLGPFGKIGDFPVIRKEIAQVPTVRDKMLFSDDDGRLYLYFGCSEEGVLLDSDWRKTRRRNFYKRLLTT